MIPVLTFLDIQTKDAAFAITIVYVCMSVAYVCVNLDSNRGEGYLNLAFCQHQQLVYNIFPTPGSGYKQGGGYLNPTISQPQYMAHSLNPVQIQMGEGGYLNPVQIQTVHYVLRLGNSWIQMPPPLEFEFESNPARIYLAVLNAAGLWRPWSLVINNGIFTRQTSRWIDQQLKASKMRSGADSRPVTGTEDFRAKRSLDVQVVHLLQLPATSQSL